MTITTMPAMIAARSRPPIRAPLLGVNAVPGVQPAGGVLPGSVGGGADGAPQAESLGASNPPPVGIPKPVPLSLGAAAGCDVASLGDQTDPVPGATSGGASGSPCG